MLFLVVEIKNPRANFQFLCTLRFSGDCNSCPAGSDLLINQVLVGWGTRKQFRVKKISENRVGSNRIFVGPMRIFDRDFGGNMSL